MRTGSPVSFPCKITNSFLLKEVKSSQSFDEWLKSKRHQRRQSLQMEKQRKKEFSEGWYVRPREDCQRAYRQYVPQTRINVLDLCTTKNSSIKAFISNRIYWSISHTCRNIKDGLYIIRPVRILCRRHPFSYC